MSATAAAFFESSRGDPFRTRSRRPGSATGSNPGSAQKRLHHNVLGTALAAALLLRWRSYSTELRLLGYGLAAISAMSLLRIACPNELKFSATMTKAPGPPTTLFR